MIADELNAQLTSSVVESRTLISAIHHQIHDSYSMRGAGRGGGKKKIREKMGERRVTKKTLAATATCSILILSRCFWGLDLPCTEKIFDPSVSYGLRRPIYLAGAHLALASSVLKISCCRCERRIY